MKANDLLGGYPYLMMMQRWARPLWYLSPIFWLIAVVPDADPNRQATLNVVVVVCRWWRRRNDMMLTGSITKQSKERLKGVKKEGPGPHLFLLGDLRDKIPWKKVRKQWQCNQIAKARRGFKLSQKNNEEVCGVGGRLKILKPRQHKLWGSSFASSPRKRNRP